MIKLLTSEQKTYNYRRALVPIRGAGGGWVFRDRMVDEFTTICALSAYHH